MFSQTVEYALRAMVQLAAEAPEACTTQHIAESTRVPGAYLAKVLQSLRRAGLVSSRRGVGGGVKLTRPPKRINLLEVINAVEPLQRNASGGKKPIASLAPLNRRLDTLLEQLQKGLASTALTDVAPAAKAKRPRTTRRA
ncbi:MAG TPA: Rrf2 family transcriptional regulator [Lacipirellulaceae bacterium]|nr:Rrf2 family transcriptional regulator [Lacipirellulaceae bacterium]HMP04985.1 Rrf2 family transcriptional regulator [Lacipirellulaceae bacterium]